MPKKTKAGTRVAGQAGSKTQGKSNLKKCRCGNDFLPAATIHVMPEIRGHGYGVLCKDCIKAGWTKFTKQTAKAIADQIKTCRAQYPNHVTAINPGRVNIPGQTEPVLITEGGSDSAVSIGREVAEFGKSKQKGVRSQRYGVSLSSGRSLQLGGPVIGDYVMKDDHGIAINVHFKP
jgi:hypothetical protein